MNGRTERRLLQLCVALACLVPLSVGLTGVVESAAMVKQVAEPLPVDLDSHFRYLSGLLLGLGIAFAACIPRIEANGPVFRMLALVVVIGGLGRAASAFEQGLPGPGHVFGLAMELAAVPLLTLWQARVARSAAEGAPTS